MRLKNFEEQVFFTTTRISITGESGQGASIGTGFLFKAPLNDENNSTVTLLISNKHVFVNPKGKIDFTFNITKSDGTPDLGNIHTFSNSDFSSIYTEHPDSNIDLACINASIITRTENKIFHKTINRDFIVDFNDERLYPGLDVWFVGYPENRFDVVNNLPLLRKGYISSLPEVDFNSKKQFVIDAQVFPGSSGSPVFVVINGVFKLIGIVTETMIKHGQLQAIPTLQMGVGVQQILGLGIVIKATLLNELIDAAVNKIREKLKTQTEPIAEK